jgi:tRNA (Thr-GGU) A37 N-methylase
LESKQQSSSITTSSSLLLASVIVVTAVTSALATTVMIRSRNNHLRQGERQPTRDDNKTTTNDKEMDNKDNQKIQKQKKKILLIQDVMEKAGGSTSSWVFPRIGVVQSVYRLCVGTPRQGMLAPHARGTIRLEIPQAEVAVQGLERFSHIWIVFVFHLNTVSSTSSSSSSSSSNNDNNNHHHQSHSRPPAKIAPPALGGIKVGTFATRSPHHYNPIGITLAKLDRIRTVKQYNNNNNNHTPTTKTNSKQKMTLVTYLDVSGIDLVDGTPVLDIKPYVATYDAPTEYSTVPAWVSEGLNQRRTVHFTETAKAQLHQIINMVHDDVLPGGDTVLQFYDDYESIMKCIQEVLAVDVRSSYQTNKARNGKFRAEQSQRLQQQIQSSTKRQTTADSLSSSSFQSSICCTQQIDNLLISYTVQPPPTVHNQPKMNRSESMGSGAEDHVIVTSIQILTTTTRNRPSTTTIHRSND